MSEVSASIEREHKEDLVGKQIIVKEEQKTK
jgi:hypothetical protein